MTAKQKLLQIVVNAKGDNLERAQASFRNLSTEEMSQSYGQSGQTCQQILDAYKKEREEWQAAYDLAAAI